MVAAGLNPEKYKLQVIFLNAQAIFTFLSSPADTEQWAEKAANF